MNRNIKFLITGVLALVFLLGLRYCFYGSVQACSYSESVVKMSPDIAQARFQFGKQAAIVRGVDTEYVCLPEMGKITNKIVPAADAENYRFQVEEAEIDLVDTSSAPELIPVKVMLVSKQAGSIQHLILKDKEGNLYEVATVSLGILNPSTRLSEEEKK
jgi:hypothetical protein